MALHSALSTTNLHEPKGAASASANTVYVASGAGTGTWTSLATFLLTGIAATIAEIVRACDVSVRNVLVGSTLAVTEALHDGKTLLLNTATGSVATLPAATGSGAKIHFKVSVLATSNSHIVKVADASDLIQGVITMVDQDTAGTVLAWCSAADSDTVTLNRSTTGSVTKGEWLEFRDVAADLWLVSGVLSNTGTGLTPFSATV